METKTVLLGEERKGEREKKKEEEVKVKGMYDGERAGMGLVEID